MRSSLGVAAPPAEDDAPGAEVACHEERLGTRGAPAQAGAQHRSGSASADVSDFEPAPLRQVVEGDGGVGQFIEARDLDGPGLAEKCIPGGAGPGQGPGVGRRRGRSHLRQADLPDDVGFLA